ncbi:MAG: hypothetical protein ACO3JL_06705 [Myxococcota bacterium]
MLSRLLLAFFLVAVGVAFPAYALFQRGAPWSYQDRAGVLLSRVGEVELYSRVDDAVSGAALEPGRWIAAGDELRVASFSRAVVRTPVAEYELIDGTRGEFLGGGHLALARGLALITVAPDATATLRGPGGDLELQRGHYRVTANGDGLLAVLVEEGAARASGVQASPGAMLVLRRGQEPELAPRPTRVPLRASIDVTQGTLTGTTSRGAQVYVDGKLLHADATGAFTASLPPGDEPVVVFARDLGGEVERSSVVRPTRSAGVRP